MSDQVKELSARISKRLGIQTILSLTQVKLPPFFFLNLVFDRCAEIMRDTRRSLKERELASRFIQTNHLRLQRYAEYDLTFYFLGFVYNVYGKTDGELAELEEGIIGRIRSRINRELYTWKDILDLVPPDTKLAQVAQQEVS